MRTRNSTGKTLYYEKNKDSWRNGTCTQYRQREIQSRQSRNEMHVNRLRAKLYGQYIPHIKSMHETYCNKLQYNMSE